MENVVMEQVRWILNLELLDLLPLKYFHFFYFLGWIQLAIYSIDSSSLSASWTSKSSSSKRSNRLAPSHFSGHFKVWMCMLRKSPRKKLTGTYRFLNLYVDVFVEISIPTPEKTDDHILLKSCHLSFVHWLGSTWIPHGNCIQALGSTPYDVILQK